VLVIVNDYGHRRGTEGEVRLFGAAIWTVRDGRAVEAEFYAERRLAYEAVGLEMPTTHA
jgi:ketosteroid isomerase-like protein